MRILYGVVGEGMGHAIRSRVVLEHLFAQNHEVEIMASGRAAGFLSKRFGDVNPIHGLHIIYEDNTVRRNKTFWSNLFKGAAGLPKNIAAYFELIEDFDPEVVISDFESWTYFYGKAHGLPVISIDNMQVINRCVLPDEVIEGFKTDFKIAKAVVKSKLPFCDHYLITSFSRPKIRKPRTTLHPPILRPEILSAKATEGDHILVYQTAEGNSALPEALAAAGVPCRVYGYRRDLTAPERDGSITYHPFDETRFVEDLASARAVVAGGGFTLLSEAVYLGKPILSIPLGGQFEQVMNARYVETLGFGTVADRATPAAVADFVRSADRYAEAVAGYHQDGNTVTLAALDRLLVGIGRRVSS